MAGRWVDLVSPNGSKLTVRCFDWDDDEQPLERTAIHEASHAVMADEVGAPITHATIEPSEGKNGHVRCDKRALSLREKIIISLASSAAQTILKLGQVDPTGCAGDMRKAKRHSRKLSPGSLVEIGIETFALVTRRWSDVRRVAQALLEHGTLTGEEIAKLLKAARHA
jgi:hypothetical protein